LQYPQRLNRRVIQMKNHSSVFAPQDSGVPMDARDFSVKDRVVIITGAGQGIGRESRANSPQQARSRSWPIRTSGMHSKSN
jgi:hypothetical protein